MVEDAGPRALVGACAHFTLRKYVVDGLLLEAASVLLHDRVYMLPGAQAISYYAELLLLLWPCPTS